jgi:hypothetical protein
MRFGEFRWPVIALALSTCATTYYLTHWPRRTLAECLQANNAIPSEDINYYWSSDLSGCLETSADAANKGIDTGAVLAGNFYSFKGNEERSRYFIRRAADLGDNEEKWEVINFLDHDDGRNCKELDGLIRSFRPFKYNWERGDAITLADVKGHCKNSIVGE